jgi:hypothetical protein
MPMLIAGDVDDAVRECKKFEAVGCEHLVFDFRFKFHNKSHSTDVDFPSIRSASSRGEVPMNSSITQSSTSRRTRTVV